ncbi:MAG: AAA family ATPase [Pseudomonadota bacterium]|jgi:flagellar biosynthesis protein FlhG
MVAEIMQDQAEGLRRLLGGDFVRIITLTGGKAGVGKTSLVVNLAVTLARRGKNVMVLDEQQGQNSVVGRLGLVPRFDLMHVVRREKSLEEVMLSGPEGIAIVPAGKGMQALAGLSAADQEWLVRSFGQLPNPVDVVLVDAAAGIASNVLPPSLAAQDLVVVVSQHAASITDSYALIKVLSRDFAKQRFHILVNRVGSEEEAMRIYDNLSQAAGRFLGVTLDFMGFVPADEKLRQAAKLGRPVVEAFPQASSTAALRRLAETVEQWPSPNGDHGRLEVFMQRLIQSSRVAAGSFGS